MIFRYYIDGSTGTIKADSAKEADIMIRETIEIKLEPEDIEKGDR